MTDWAITIPSTTFPNLRETARGVIADEFGVDDDGLATVPGEIVDQLRVAMDAVCGELCRAIGHRNRGDQYTIALSGKAHPVHAHVAGEDTDHETMTITVTVQPRVTLDAGVTYEIEPEPSP